MLDFLGRSLFDIAAMALAGGTSTHGQRLWSGEIQLDRRIAAPPAQIALLLVRNTSTAPGPGSPLPLATAAGGISGAPAQPVA